MICQRIVLGVCLLALGTTRAQLPHKVIEMKDSLLHELHALQEVIPEDRLHHLPEHQIDGQVHQMLDEFLAQNQESIAAVLRVLKLIDHDLENVIQDCVRVFDLNSLKSSNVLFGQVTKPLLLKVRDLCEMIAENKVDEIEPGLERVEREAAIYQQRLDQTLEEIAAVSSQLDGDHFQGRIQLKEEQILAHLQLLNSTLLTEMDQNFTNYFTKWIGKYKNFSQLLPDVIVYNPEEHPHVAALYDFLDFLDNETGILQDDLEDFLYYWTFLVEETLESITNGTETIVSFLRDYPLEDLLNGKTHLRCAAKYYQNFERPVVNLLNEYYRCVDYEDEIMKAFQHITSVLDSTDKAVDFVLDSYIICARLAGQFEDDFGLAECLDDLGELLDQTREFVEHKMNEIYYHVDDAMAFNGVIMGACIHMKARDTVLQVGKKLGDFESCSENFDG